MTQPLDVLGGLDDSAAYKVPCAVATTADMTNKMIGLPIIDGYQTKLGDRVLVWMNTDQTTNGIYWIPSGPLPVGVPPPVSTGAWVRAIDFSNPGSYVIGTQVLVNNGATYGGQIFDVTEAWPVITFGLSTIAATATAAAVAAEQQATAAATSAAAAQAAAAGLGGASTISLSGGTYVLDESQAHSATLTLTGSLAANQYINFPNDVTNAQLCVIQNCTLNGYTIYLRGGGGTDMIGVWFSSVWNMPMKVVVTPSRVYWGGYEAKPPGTYEEYPVGSAIPPGRLICDGSSYSTTVYDLLFSIIGYTFGGSGSSFNVPDDRGYALAAADNLGTGAGSAGRLNGWNVGVTGGEAAHTLLTTEMPSHTHSALALSSTPGTNGSSSFDQPQAGGVTGSTGGGGAHNNVQPTRTVMRTIRF